MLTDEARRRVRQLASSARLLAQSIERYRREATEANRRLADAEARHANMTAEIESLMGDSPLLPHEV